MDHFGPDVSVRETSLCVVDETGTQLREARVPTEPGAIASLLAEAGLACKRIGLEAGPTSQWLCAEPAAAGLPVIWVEARLMCSAPSARRVPRPTAHHARGIADDARGPLPPRAMSGRSRAWGARCCGPRASCCRPRRSALRRTCGAC